MKTHKFDVEDANDHGVYKAILLEHLKYHQESNHGNPDLTFDGKTYAFIKKATIEKMFSYLNYDSVRKWLKELEDDGIIESCKPHAKSGYHLKYYHVKSIGIKSQSSETESQSLNETTSHSSILPNEEPNGRELSFFDQIEDANTKPKLLEIWNTYRKSKGKHMNLYEREVLMKSRWKSKTVSQIKSSILYTIENGWFTLQEREVKNSESKPSYYKEL